MEKELERPDSDGEGGGGGSQEGKEGGADGETEEEVKRSPKYIHSFFVVSNLGSIFCTIDSTIARVFFEL